MEGVERKSLLCQESIIYDAAAMSNLSVTCELAVTLPREAAQEASAERFSSFSVVLREARTGAHLLGTALALS
jgi:hypothetical protein